MEEGIEVSVNIESSSQAIADRERRFIEAEAERQPLVTGKWGRILASSPTGFVIKTGEVQGRLEGFAIRDFTNKNILRRLFRKPKRSKELTYPARENVHDANQKERAFHQGQENKRAESEERDPATITIDDVGGKPKLVVREWETRKETDPETQRSVDVLELTYAGNSYQGYRAMSGVDAGDAERKLGMILGVAMGIVTSDGYIIIQKRGKNATYGDDTDEDKGRGIPGASAAGTLDAKMAPRSAIHERAARLAKPSGNIGIMIEPIDTDFITAGMYREGEEEDGLQKGEIEIIPSLFIQDDINPHYEIGMTGRTTLKAVDFIKRATENQAIKRDRHDFSERVLVLTPQELEKMLTEVEVPWPSTHALTMMGTLQQAYIQQGMPPEEAEAKLFEVQEKWYENNRRINERIRRFYDEHPDALTRNRQKAANVTDLGYDPRVFGKDQGIESLNRALRRVDIVPTTEVAFSAIEQTAINGYLESYWEQMDPMANLSDGISSFLSEVGFHLDTGRSDLGAEQLEETKIVRAIDAKDKMRAIVRSVIDNIPEEFDEQKSKFAEVLAQLEDTFPRISDKQAVELPIAGSTTQQEIAPFDKALKTLDLYVGELSRLWKEKINKQMLERIWADERIDGMTKMALQLRMNKRHSYSYASLGEIETIVIGMRELDERLRGQTDEPIFVNNPGNAFFYHGLGMTDGNGLEIVQTDANSPLRRIVFGRALTQQETYKGVNNPIPEVIQNDRLILSNDSYGIFNMGDRGSFVTIGEDELKNVIRSNHTIDFVANLAWLFERTGTPIDEFLGTYYEGSDVVMIKQLVSGYRQKGTYLP